MTEVAYLSGLAVVLVGVGAFARRERRRRTALDRIQAADAGPANALMLEGGESLIVERPFVPIVVGVAAAVLIVWITGWPLSLT